MARRCCIECGLIYRGDLACPDCNGMGEPLRAGRPRLPVGDKKTCRIEVRVSSADLAKIDSDRGTESRSDYLARLAREAPPIAQPPASC